MKTKVIDLGSRGEITKPIRVNINNVSNEPMEVHVHVRGYVHVESEHVSEEELARQVRASLNAE